MRALLWGGIFLLLLGGCRPDPLKREVASLLKTYPRDVAFFSRSSMGMEPELRFQLEAGNIQSAWMVFTRRSLPGGWAPLQARNHAWLMDLEHLWDRLGGGSSRVVDWLSWEAAGGDEFGWVLAVGHRILKAYTLSELSGREASALWMMLDDTARQWGRSPVLSSPRALALLWLGRMSTLPQAPALKPGGPLDRLASRKPVLKGGDSWLAWGRLLLSPRGQNDQ